MTAGIKANVDGSAAIQVGGTDVVTLTSGGAVTFVTSPTTLQAGTASAPSITFSGDTNTGIYSPGADTLAFAEGGVEAMRINSDAQVVTVAGTASLPALTFTGDTNTGIYSPGADRIGFTEGGTQVGEFDASGNFLMNSGYGSVAIAYGCRVWVSFNGTGAIAVRASGNVSTLGDNGNGDYTVNFSNSMPDTNYVVTGTCFSTATGTTRGFISHSSTVAYSPATGSFRFCSIAAGVGNTDYQYEYISIFR